MERTSDIRTRAPKAAKPRRSVLLRLDEEEFAALEGMAEKEERSRSNMARLLYLQGVAISQKKKQ
ncbi:ribbon-helix-helix protein, CopG family [Salmonella enterica subsp. enterica serovar Poona]|nr:ribbon-helix-helix protein, CopG family [Salmonella enterica subsp. enterica serovar Poona]EAP4179693.1 ribbon-helix-helix protein, CopG family [Salmonella enterica subsp. enterica serovar Oranienburg]EAP4199523.1 ribbon-helix-helix protein, CopG family [Salmonella enterica subsp. enterica serovar Poona]EAR0434997.1 ribbon-helix-helix protein, CopG family [Salmonella enterica subsp. enterica serovar Poona]